MSEEASNIHSEQGKDHGLFPPHFHKGAQIRLSSGEIKKVEDLSAEDFKKCTEQSKDLKLDSSTVAKIERDMLTNMILLSFLVGQTRLQITVEAPAEHPFYVYGKGWSSVDPINSMKRYNLNCQTLNVGDVCASLTRKQSDFGV